MADISTEIAEIQEASYGSEVRQSIVDGLNKVNAETLPAVSVSDAGKFLAVNNNGQWEVKSGGLIPTPTGTKSITENGTHDVTNYASANVNVPNSYSASDEGKVVDNGALVPQTSRSVTQNGTYDTTTNDEVVVNVQGGGGGTIQPLSVNANGTYTPLSGVDGYAPVIVNVSGGGAELMTQAQWDALTTAQKNAKGLVAIQRLYSGYIRGILVNGADYGVINEYLPYSDVEMVDCFARYENFVNDSATWGDRSSPITVPTPSVLSRYLQEDAVYFDAKSAQKQISLPLGGENTDFTIYVVAKGTSYAIGDILVMGSVKSWYNDNLIMLYHRSGTIWRSSIYGSDADLVDTNGDYVAIAIRSSSMNASWFANNGAKRTGVSYANHGMQFSFGWFPGGGYGADLAVKFVGYVKEAESDENIQNNLANLASIYNLSS